jgi:transcription antitermination factor NusG
MQIDTINLNAALRDKETRWCAVQTRYQHERLANGILASKGFETFLPTFAKISQWKDRKKTIWEALFPGYLFVANIGERRIAVTTTPGVCSIVSTSGVPATIPANEIEAIRRAISSPYPTKPHANLKEGERVRVSHGPLTGIEGILIRKGSSTRLILSIEMLGRAAAVEIDGACVESAAPRSELSQYSATSRIERYA